MEGAVCVAANLEELEAGSYLSNDLSFRKGLHTFLLSACLAGCGG
jgi:hypothetical protein